MWLGITASETDDNDGWFLHKGSNFLNFSGDSLRATSSLFQSAPHFQNIGRSEKILSVWRVLVIFAEVVITLNFLPKCTDFQKPQSNFQICGNGFYLKKLFFSPSFRVLRRGRKESHRTFSSCKILLNFARIDFFPRRIGYFSYTLHKAQPLELRSRRNDERMAFLS